MVIPLRKCQIEEQTYHGQEGNPPEPPANSQPWALSSATMARTARPR